MRHSGFDASEHTQGFGIEPYFVYRPLMVAIAKYDSNAFVASAPPDDHIWC